MNIEKLNNDKDLKIYNLDYINTIGYECEQGVVYFNHDSLEYEINRVIQVQFKYAANRVIQMQFEDRSIIYTRNSNRINDNTIKMGNLKIKYTYEKNRYAYYIIRDRRLYMGIIDDNENLNIMSIVSGHMREVIKHEGCYKDNNIKKLIKVLDRAYEMMFGDSETELTPELNIKLIQLRKREVLTSNSESIRYEKNLEELKRIANKEIKDIINAKYKNEFIGRFLIIDSPLDKSKKVKLPCITSRYAKHILEYFNLITDWQYENLEPEDFEGYALVMQKQNNIIVTLNLIRIDNSIEVVITKENMDASCKEAKDYLDFRMIKTHEHYSLSNVPKQYALILISILVQTKVLDKYSGIKNIHGFKDINIVKYIGEI